MVGNIGRYPMDGVAQVTYWIGSAYQGRGIATAALKLFLELDSGRPIEARTAFDNIASGKVLNKNGFQIIGKDIYFSNARGVEVEETIWSLA